VRDRESLKRDLPLSAQVFFILEGELGEAQFRRVWSAVCMVTGNETATDSGSFWLALERRRTERLPWSKLVPRPPIVARSPEEGRTVRETFHVIANIERVRGYPSVVAEGTRFSFDWFNPGGELELGYVGEGNPVLMLLVERDNAGGLVHELAAFDLFWNVLREVSRILLPRSVCGTWSIASYALAQNEGKAELKSPWDYMFPVQLLTKPRHLSDRERLATGHDWTSTNDSLLLLWPILQSPQFRKAPMSRWFGRLDVWDENKVMVLVSPGLDGVIRPEYREAARALGMTSIVELIPGAYD